jgi:hypothetical protein
MDGQLFGVDPDYLAFIAEIEFLNIVIRVMVFSMQACAVCKTLRVTAEVEYYSTYYLAV